MRSSEWNRTAALLLENTLRVHGAGPVHIGNRSKELSMGT